MSNQNKNPYNYRCQETIEQHHQSIKIASLALRDIEKQEDIKIFDDHFRPIVVDLQEIKYTIKTTTVLCLCSFIMNGAIILMVLNNG